LTIHDIGDSATVNVRLSALEEDRRRPTAMTRLLGHLRQE